MLKLKYFLPMLLVLLLTACGEEPEPEVPPTPPKHAQAALFVWDELTVNAITPVTAFETNGSDLQIYPYFDDDKYILMRKIFLSNNNFWNTVTATFQDTDNYISSESYSLFTLENGYTVALIPIDEETAYVVSSNQLPSAYVEKVCDTICQ